MSTKDSIEQLNSLTPIQREVALKILKDTLEKNTGFNGRPAKLYRFKDDIKERNLF